MKGIIKGEFTRLVKNKLTWIFLIVSVAAVFITTGTYALMNLLMETTGSADALMGDIFGIYDFKSLYNLTYNSDLIILVITVMTVLYASQPYRSGFIKTITNVVTPKYKLIIPEYICVFTYAVLVSFVSGIAVFAFGSLMFKGFFASLTLKGILKIVAFVAAHSLLLGSFACMTAGITNVLKNTALSLISNLLYACGFGTIIYQLITLLLNKLDVVKEDFTLVEYTVIGNVYGMTVDSLADDIIRVVIVCIIVVWSSAMFSSMMMEKQDIK
ncbi:MAG: hypothetical protein IKJ75_03745 [Clostridia bacterium]|nr:hypothetical protein [Clostridia bacterium]